MKNKILALTLAVMMVIAMLPVGVSADTTYYTIDGVANAELEGTSLHRTGTLHLTDDVTITGKTCVFPYGIALNGYTLTFVGCNVTVSGMACIENATTSWMTIRGDNHGLDHNESNLVLDSTSMTVIGNGTASAAIYIVKGGVTMTNASTLTIQDYTGGALTTEYDADISIDNSNVVLTNNGGGLGTHSDVTVTNNSTLTITDNADYGLSLNGDGNESSFDATTTLTLTGNAEAIKVDTGVTATIDGMVEISSTGEHDIRNLGTLNIAVDNGDVRFSSNSTGVAEYLGSNLPKPFCFSIMMFMVGFGEAAVVDKNGKAVEGAAFDLYTKRGTKRGTYTTDENGVLTTRALMSNTYYLVPAGEAFNPETAAALKIKGRYDVTKIAITIDAAK